jgi:N,N'-diacetyllegionaminate synthase
LSGELTIGSRQIGTGHPTLVIAEIGVNHDGSVELALELLDAAKRAGADAAKIQLFSAQRLMHPSSGFAEYQKHHVKDDAAIDMLRRYELDDKEVRQIANAAADLGLMLLATPFSPGDMPLVESLNLPAVKIASPDLVNKPLLRQAAVLGRPLLVSTGAASIDEVAEAVGWLREWNASFALLHCVSSYPTATEDIHLGWIGDLAQRFNVPVGYSDHAGAVLAGALAVAAGAVLVEKHLTYDRAASGPDHAASFELDQLARYVNLIRLAESMRGDGEKRVLECEQDVRRTSRQSLVLARMVSVGSLVGPSDLTVQRPGTGVPAAAIDQIVGRRALRPLRPGEMLRWDMVA